jgi:PAS domain S-box-containing protein
MAGPINHNSNVNDGFEQESEKKCFDPIPFTNQNNLAFLNFIPLMVSYIDHQEVFKYTNKAFKDFFQINTNSIIGKSLNEILDESTYKRVKIYLERAAQGNEAKFTESIEQADDKSIYIEAHLHPDKGPSGETCGYWLILQDITEKTLAEKKLKESKEKYYSLFNNAPSVFSVPHLMGAFLK